METALLAFFPGQPVSVMHAVLVPSRADLQTTMRWTWRYEPKPAGLCCVFGVRHSATASLSHPIAVWEAPWWMTRGHDRDLCDLSHRHHPEMERIAEGPLNRKTGYLQETGRLPRTATDYWVWFLSHSEECLVDKFLISRSVISNGSRDTLD